MVAGSQVTKVIHFFTSLYEKNGVCMISRVEMGKMTHFLTLEGKSAGQVGCLGSDSFFKVITFGPASGTVNRVCL